MSTIVLLLVINVISAIGTIISSYFKIKIEEKNETGNGDIKGFRSFTFAGYVFYICIILSAVLPIIQKAVQDNIDKDEKLDQKNEQDNRDNKLRASYDSSIRVMKSEYDTSTFTITKILGKYGYKLDSARGQLIRLTDSVRTLTMADPNFGMPLFENMPGIQLVDSSKDCYNFRFNMISADAASSYFTITNDIVLLDRNNHLRYLPLAPLFEYLDKQPKDIITYQPYPLCGGGAKGFKSLYLYIKGSYKRIDNSGHFNIDDLYVYETDTKKVSLVLAEEKDKILHFIKSERLKHNDKR